MTLPLTLLYVIYLLLVGVFVLYSFFNIYHLLRFGSPFIVTISVSLLYLLGAVTLLSTSWVFIGGIDWSTTIDLLAPPTTFFQ
ncbi:MAG: hypothetical protein G01um101431_580 [Parcubacteria group bacterium Gr01-1014_31]|nr:MAG: hypothetical protein G01um101431_580 [Parcubacteria group bacterium Gr01-1014_31]